MLIKRNSIQVKMSPDPIVMERGPLYQPGDYVFYDTLVENENYTGSYDNRLIDGKEVPFLGSYKVLRVYGTVVENHLHTYKDEFEGTSYDTVILTDPEFHEGTYGIDKFVNIFDSVINVEMKL